MSAERVAVERAADVAEGDRVHVVNTANGSPELQGEVLRVDGDTIDVSVCGVRSRSVTFEADGTASVQGACWTFRVEVEVAA